MQSVPRLFSQFQPSNYKIHWDLTQATETKTITGKVIISGQSSGDKTIQLHQKDLAVDSVKLDGQPAKSFTLNPSADLLEITLTKPTTASIKIEIDFHLELSDTMHGIYPCYFEVGGTPKQLLATQFESHHARETMPCIDEPEAKATFDVSLAYPAGQTALSNTPASKTTEQGGVVTTKFQTTPVMSSYLLAFVVGEMQSKSAKSASGIDVAIWSTKAQDSAALDFALKAATEIIDFYQDYFGVKYPLTKCDHVALPDFSSGAMENWGLITYRESCLLVDPATASTDTKHLVASVIAHELAHQWFGNLVTMRWWNNLWLNESFADFMEHIAIDHLYPEYETWLDFTLSRGIAALRRDAIDGVQPVQVEVHHPDEISTIFDGAIVYGKGARLMNMLYHYIGDQAFRDGLKDYFNQFAYKNTDGEDLWRCLANASGKDVSKLMNPWISQPGYPVLTVEPNSISQQQFFIGEHAASDQIWPVLLSTEPIGNLPEILTGRELQVAISPDQRFNTGDTSHFVTLYSPKHLQNLLKNIHLAPTIDRLTLLNDQTLLVRAGYLSSAKLIDLASYYNTETDNAVWDIISLTLGELRRFVETDPEAEQKLRQLSRRTAASQFKVLGVNKTDDELLNSSRLRPTIISMMLYGEDQSVINQMLDTYSIDSLSAMPAELRSLYIATITKYSNDTSAIERLLKTYATTHQADLRDDLTAGLTSTRDPELARKLLTNCLNSKIVRPQDVAMRFIYLIRNRHTRAVAWSWLTDNWDWIVTVFGGDKSFDEFPRYAASGLVTNGQLNDYRQFFEPKKSEPALKRVIEMGIAEIEARIELIKRDGEAVRKRLMVE